jgi:hypothetical protein
LTSSRWQPWKIEGKVVTPAAANSRAQFGLELQQDREMARLGADDRHVELDHSIV